MDFDYRFLDGLMSLPPTDISSALAKAQPTTGTRLGPLIEYAYTRLQHDRRHLPTGNALIDTGSMRMIEGCAQRRAGTLTTTSLEPNEVEIAMLPVPIAGSGVWSAFTRRMVNAAKRAGFDDLSAKAMGAAFGELADNAINHSELPIGATIAYRWVASEFEMVIADPGIGIRASLRKNPRHSAISDDQAALEQATTMGVTRHADGTGHGTGFKTVFDAIASFSGLLRFRSGTAALILDGTRLGSITRKSRQRAHFQGFLATIRCSAQ